MALYPTHALQSPKSCSFQISPIQINRNFPDWSWQPCFQNIPEAEKGLWGKGQSSVPQTYYIHSIWFNSGGERDLKPTSNACPWISDYLPHSKWHWGKKSFLIFLGGEILDQPLWVKDPNISQLPVLFLLSRIMSCSTGMLVETCSVGLCFLRHSFLRKNLPWDLSFSSHKKKKWEGCGRCHTVAP